MKTTKRMFVAGMLAVATIGCATRRDTIAQAEKTEKNRPGIAETKAIAEEGFIYGLPIVMNYAVMYDFVIDRQSSQWKAPFNTIYIAHRVATYKDTVFAVRALWTT